MLKLENISAAYSGRNVLEDVSLSVKDTEIVALIGPSGAGKSTLINCITGLHKLSEGTISLSGEVVSPEQKSIAWIPQNYGLLPWKSVKENISLGVVLKKNEKLNEKDLLALSKELGLSSLLNKYPTELSGGQQQRVAIARAMLMKPDIFLLDEPFSALDAITREKMQQLFLLQWQRLPKPTILITHDVEEAVFLGSKIALLSGKPGQIKTVIDNPSFKIDSDKKRLTSEFYETMKLVREVLEQS